MNPWEVLAWIVVAVFAVPVVAFYVTVIIAGIAVLVDRVKAYQRRHRGR